MTGLVINFPMPAWKAIIHKVAAHHGISYATIISRTRRHIVVFARQEAMYLAVRDTNKSLSDLGRRFSRHHTTIVHGVISHALRHGLPVPRNLDRWKPSQVRTKTRGSAA